MAVSNQTFSDIGGAVSDLFSSQESAAGLRIKAQGDLAEGQEYGLASDLATQNAQFTANSTAIKEMQQQREVAMTMGAQEAGTASAGFAAGGSSLDLLRESASQGALQKQVLGQQGLITEAGYNEQAQSYTLMQNAANQAAASEESLADKTTEFGDISAAIKGVAAVASVFTGGAFGLPGLPGGDAAGAGAGK